MKVEIQPDVHETAARLGADVPYALRALVGQLVDDPDRGRPSGLPGILDVAVDGSMFDDCPDLSVGYIREPDRIEIRFLRAAVGATTGPPQEQREEERPRPADPVADALTVREVADAWGRVTAWLRRHAPDSYAALRPGASAAALAALEDTLAVPIPLALRTLWTLTAGDDGAGGRGCLPGNAALMDLDAVAACHRRKSDAQAHQDARAEDERVTIWEPTRIPVVSLGPADTTSGLYLDTTTGFLGHWSRYREVPGEEELDTLVTYLEEMADMLESPALAGRDQPGLIGGTLVWLSSIDPARETGWRPATG
ncbi:hypothetical protein IAG44_05700 [Streptomyces roseirectus]|uniref:Knr4/Smi1-like domain-containing protein n=1 Tax=Streptomyces roseirectus TaxID=2768066 RepID=A0A7H0I877_9ACTN|nr:hypothetical protein [Streptomyces roseirectus]QNP68993.1 hypothetical protein IAG44_05700 [Streptomyces roseirectus]